MKPMIILDVGEGTALSQIDVQELVFVINQIVTQTGYPLDRVVIKPQLFEFEPPNKPLTQDQFTHLYYKCQTLELQCTASIFDKSSLDFLLGFEVPFVKIANRRYLRKFIDLIPRGIEVAVSLDDDVCNRWAWHKSWMSMCCVSNYAASIESYTDTFCIEHLYSGISDHTVGLDLFKNYRPRVYEKHFYVDGMSGPSIGPWAIDEDGLRELLEVGGR